MSHRNLSQRRLMDRTCWLSSSSMWWMPQWLMPAPVLPRRPPLRRPLQWAFDTRAAGRGSASVAPSPPSSPASLFSGALSAVLHHPGASLRVTPTGSPVLDQLKLQLREMRDDLELLKSQHKKEVKLLMSELDEEKKIRLSLQVEVDRIKKQLSKSS
ncbi:SH3 domain-containing kinase-binding protein 1 [Sardina pilchardus]|uniref:SH3 domain-containing kinase-binding protein 1 n=1 Tax=Sardina pilchardus TaxID=27697 RepID=UPI002E15D965